MRRATFPSFARVASLLTPAPLLPARRIYVGKDPETGLCKGFGFISFEDKSDAEAAMKKLHGLPYDHLILQVQWSVPREPKPDRG